MEMQYSWVYIFKQNLNYFYYHFPSISRGVYGYPLNEAAIIALKTVMNYLKTHTDIEQVRFVLFGQNAYQAYDKTLQALVK